jgi:hypothetical protein
MPQDYFAILVQPTSQATAEAGTNNNEPMTPLRTKQLVEALPRRDYTQIDAPNSGISAVVLDEPGNLNRTYYYAVTFVTANGETEPTAEANRPGASPANQKVTVTIPLGPTGTTARKIYRNYNSGSFLYETRLVGTVNDNSTTTFVDNVAEGSEGAFALSVNTTGGFIHYVNDVRVAQADQGSTSIGWAAGGEDNAGFHNTNYGYYAGNKQSNTYWNTNLGAFAGEKAVDGFECTNVGYRAGQNAVNPTYNTLVGVLAGYLATTSSARSCLGYAAGAKATTSTNATHIGQRAGGELITDVQNTTLGSVAGTFIADGLTALTTATNCLYLGYDSRALADDANNEIVIGAGVVGAGDLTCTIGTRDQVLFRTYGAWRCYSQAGGDMDYSWERIDASGVTQAKMRWNNSADQNWYLQTTTSNTNVMRVASTGAVGFYEPVVFDKAIQFQVTTWFTSADTKQRFHFEADGRTYFWGHGTNPFDFKDKDFNTILAYTDADGWALRLTPSATPTSNGDLVFERTSNTQLTFKLKGTDGTVRTGNITLS